MRCRFFRRTSSNVPLQVKLLTPQEKTPEQHVPNGSAANQDDVEQYNRKIRAKQTTVAAPVDGSASEGVKEKPPAKKPVPITKPTFAWRRIGGWDVDTTDDKDEALENVKAIEDYVMDHFYGDWYYNTVLLVGTCFFSYLLARWGFGFLLLGIVFVCTASVYRAEFRRFNRDIRDDMARVDAVNRLDNELETMEWLNSFLAKFWVIYMPALSEMVMFQTNAVLKDQAPGFGIEALSLDEFTLGSKAPRVDSIKSYARKGQDHIEMDWAFSFTPNDTDDMTKNEIKKKISPKVALGVTIGKAFISKTLPILVEDMSFTGRMNIKLKLTENFPHVKMVSVCFLEAPVIDYALKPVGGDTLGIDIMSFIPGLSTFVNGLIHSILRPLLYAPNSLDIDVEDIMAQQSNDSIGVIAVTVKRVMNLKYNGEIKDDEFHPYVKIGVSNNGKIEERTKVKKNTKNPVFLETKYILVNSLEGNHLSLGIFHMVPDKLADISLGILDIPLVDLLQKETQLDVVKNITESGKVVGKIEYDLRWFGAMQPQVLDDGTKEQIIDTEVGIVKLSLFSACDLDISHSVVGLLNPYAELYVNDELVKTTRTLRLTNEPLWGITFESLVTQQSLTQVQVLVKDANENTIVGRLDANLQDLIFESSRGQQWITAPPLREGGPETRFRIGAKWKALGMDQDVLESYTNASIGGLRLHVRGAQGLVNLEAVGDVDPYVRVVQNGKAKAKTSVIENTSNPIWNDVFFLPIANEHQHILMEMIDAEPEGKDRPLGSCAITVKDFLKKNPDGTFLAYDGSNEIIEQPVLYNGKSYGTMTYSVSFVPHIPVYTHSQLTHMDAYLESKEKKEIEEKEAAVHAEALYKANPEQYEWVEMQDDILSEPARVDMPLEKAIAYRAGNVVVHVLRGQFNRPDYFVHTLFDEHGLPSNVSPRAEGRKLDVPSSAEAFVRDLPNSKLVFRLSTKAEVSDEREIGAEKVFSTLEILKKAYSKPTTLRIDDGNLITVQLEYVPSAVKLAPLDTVLDVGYIKLDIVGAEHLNSVDSNGKSDPLCVVKLDGIEIFKTDKKRKTLDPVWNESVDFPMLSRSRQSLILEVYDWDLTHPDELLGKAVVDLSTIEPNTSAPFQVALDTKGLLNLRATFKPEYIRPKVAKRSGLQVDLSDVAGAPLKIVGGAADVAGNVASNVAGTGIGLVSDGVAKGGSFFKGLGRSKKKRDEGDDSMADTTMRSDQASTYSMQTGTTSSYGTPSRKGVVRPSSDKNHVGAPSHDEQKELSKAPSIRNGHPNLDPSFLPPPQRPGDVNGHRRLASEATDISTINLGVFGPDGIPGRVNIISARGFKGSALEVKSSLSTPAKTKDVHKTRTAKAHGGIYSWNETFVFKAPTDGLLLLLVREHHTLGRSQTVGSAQVQLSEYLNKDGIIVLSVGDGELTINLRYVTALL